MKPHMSKLSYFHRPTVGMHGGCLAELPHRTQQYHLLYLSNSCKTQATNTHCAATSLQALPLLLAHLRVGC